jgi:hypothetical protein
MAMARSIKGSKATVKRHASKPVGRTAHTPERTAGKLTPSAKVPETWLRRNEKVVADREVLEILKNAVPNRRSRVAVRATQIAFCTGEVTHVFLYRSAKGVPGVKVCVKLLDGPIRGCEWPLAAKLTPHASRFFERRLRALGVRGPMDLLRVPLVGSRVLAQVHTFTGAAWFVDVLGVIPAPQ